MLERQESCLHIGIHETEAHGRIQVELGNVLKPKTLNNCNKHMGSVDKSDRMADSYRLSCRLGGNGQKSCFFFIFIDQCPKCICTTEDHGSYMAHC